MASKAVVFTLMMMVGAFSGCLGGGGDVEDDGGPTSAGGVPTGSADGDDGQDGGDEASDQDQGDEEGGTGDDDPDPAPSGGGGGGSGGSGGSGGTTACYEYSTPRPVPPQEQEVDETAEVRCPGHFVVLSEGDGAVYEVPSWSAGDWWRYEDQVMENPPQEFQETVNGTDTQWDLEVYQVYTQEWDEDGELREAGETIRTKDSLMQIFSGGAINHELLFPLAANKSWYAMSTNRALMTAEVQHESGFMFQGEGVEAWRVEVHIERESGQESIKRLWFGVEAGNVLREELWGAENGTATMQVRSSELVDWQTAG